MINKAAILPIDFSKPWWHVFWQQKKLFFTITCWIILDDSTLTFLPVVVGWVFVQQSFIFLFFVVASYVLIEVCGLFFYNPPLNKVYAQMHESFRYNAYKHLLGIDPIFHTQRSSGIIIGKIQRTTQAYYNLTDVLLDDIVPFIVEVSTVMISLLVINVYLGILGIISIVITSTLFCIVAIRTTSAIEELSNKADDTASQLTAESLAQLQFIRAVFMSNEIRKNIFDAAIHVINTSIKLWTIYAWVRSIFIVFFWTVFGILIAFLIHLVQQQQLSPVLATTLVIMYLRGTKGIFSLDQKIKTIVTTYRRIKDFYAFARVFGKQTFPVFPEDIEQPVVAQPTTMTEIFFDKITFAYPHQEYIFYENSLNLLVDATKINKLYGIIGPSGLGKTTFISILGGQLKPQDGNVFINGVDIYTADDAIRRKLIAMQGQIATSMRGSLRFNLLFGLPHEHMQNDAMLIKLLQAVGLWQIFEYKEGLDTLVGEGGMNLSGGQRQRLNFANLFLRANFYKPALILIDEPTSSLDELSEKAITTMIEQLASKSVTFVIAHRLKTLEDAYKILDFSLLWSDNIFEFCTPEELKKKSEYYRQLLTGRQSLE